MATQTHSVALPPALAGATPAPRRVSLYVLIDALGWPLAQGADFLAAQLPFRRALRTTLGYSSGAIPTILTGQLPQRHGRWNLLYLDPEHSPFRWLRHCPQLADSFLDSRYGRAALTRLGRHGLGLGPGFECALRPGLLPWFNWAERRPLYQSGSVAGATTAFDVWAASRVPYRIFYYRDGRDFELIRQARAALESGQASTVFLYLSELDGYLHQELNHPRAVARRLAGYAAGLEELLAAAMRLDPGARVRIFSDHGMTAVRSRVDLAAGVRALGWSMPQDYLAVYDSTMLRCWFFNPAARANCEAYLRAQTCGRVLDPGELRDFGLAFADARYGELIYLLDPGVMVAHGEFNGSGWNPCGMHGYDPAHPDSDAVLLSNQSQDLSMSHIRDLFGCLCEPAMVAYAA
jgi:hypothetical protein